MAPNTGGHAQQVTHELDDAEIRSAAHQRQRNDRLTRPCLGDLHLEHDVIVIGGGRREGVIRCDAGFVRLLVDELAAHSMPVRQIADRRRSRQRLNGQVATITLRQPRCCASASIHLAPPLKTSGGTIRSGNVNPASRVTRI
jgi:hypothetical protein